MKRMLFNATYQEELRVAMVESQKLIDFDIETTAKEQRRGNIYKAFITRVEPSLEACFVDYGMEKQGFLPFKEIDYAYLPEHAKGKDFNKLAVGTELIIQVEKDERGNKGAALTTYITLPGRYLVLMPNNPRAGGVSRRIEGEERDELKNLMSQLEVPQGMSIIIRTAALGRSSEELQWDLSYLLRLWDAITGAASSHKGAFLIYQESNLVIRSIRDHFFPDVSEILIDMEEVYNNARNFMAQVMPQFVNRIKLYRDDVPLFSRFQIEHQIESAYSRTVNLPSGGAIVIDHTEALTSIDVNSAKANKGADIEATALATNIEAAEEISRQMRLRDLGGLIVIDFIDMENIKNQREVELFFKQQLTLDRARIQLGKLSKFGLLELSRQRLKASLEESSAIPCPRCAGVGSIRGIESSAVHILRIVQEEVVKNSHYLTALHIQLPVEIATYLLNEKRDDVTRIEARMKVKLVLIPNLHLESPNYKIKKISSDNNEIASKLSYNLVELPEDIVFNHNNEKNTTHKAMVQNIAPIPAPQIKPNSIKSYLKKFWNKLSNLFDSETTQSVTKTQNKSSGKKIEANLKIKHTKNNNQQTVTMVKKPTSQQQKPSKPALQPQKNQQRTNASQQNKTPIQVQNQHNLEITEKNKQELENTKEQKDIEISGVSNSISSTENIKPISNQNHHNRQNHSPKAVDNKNNNNSNSIDLSNKAIDGVTENRPKQKSTITNKQTDSSNNRENQSHKTVSTQSNARIKNPPHTENKEILNSNKDTVAPSPAPIAFAVNAAIIQEKITALAVKNEAQPKKVEQNHNTTKTDTENIKTIPPKIKIDLNLNGLQMVVTNKNITVEAPLTQVKKAKRFNDIPKLEEQYSNQKTYQQIETKGSI